MAILDELLKQENATWSHQYQQKDICFLLWFAFDYSVNIVENWETSNMIHVHFSAKQFLREDFNFQHTVMHGRLHISAQKCLKESTHVSKSNAIIYPIPGEKSTGNAHKALFTDTGRSRMANQFKKLIVVMTNFENSKNKRMCFSGLSLRSWLTLELLDNSSSTCSLPLNRTSTDVVLEPGPQLQPFSIWSPDGTCSISRFTKG